MTTQAQRHADPAYLQAVAWDQQSRSWVPVSPLYAAQPEPNGYPEPCPTCGTTRPCTHAHQREVYNPPS